MRSIYEKTIELYIVHGVFMILFHQYLDYDALEEDRVAQYALISEISKRLELFNIPFSYGQVEGEGIGLIVDKRTWISGVGYDSAYSKVIDYLPESTAKQNLSLYSRNERQSIWLKKILNESIHAAVAYIDDPETPEIAKENSLESKLSSAIQLGFDINNIYYHETSYNNAQKIREGGFKLTQSTASTSDSAMPHGVFFKPNDDVIDVAENPVQIPIFLKRTQTLTFNDRKELENYFDESPEIAALRAAGVEMDDGYTAKYDKHVEYYNKNTPRGLGDPEISKAHYAECDRILGEWKSEIESHSNVIKHAQTNYLMEQGVESIVVKNDEGSFGRIVTSIVHLDPSNASPVTTNFNKLKAMEIKAENVYSLNSHLTGATAPNIHPRAGQAKKLLDKDFSSDNVKLSSLLLLGDEIVGVSAYKIENNEFRLDVKAFGAGNSYEGKEHMIERALDDLGTESRNHPNLTAGFITEDPDIRKALMRRGFFRDGSFDTAASMIKAPAPNKIVQSVNYIKGVDNDEVYATLAMDIGLEYKELAKYKINEWAEGGAKEENRGDYPFIIKAIDALPFSNHESEYLKERCLMTLESFSTPEETIEMACRR
jgi:hypothetical protein